MRCARSEPGHAQLCARILGQPAHQRSLRCEGNITITHSYISTGDDDIAIKGGPGGVTNMTVSHNHFYRGHGMSIGSETDGGVSKVRVFDLSLSLDGADNGIRIKSNAARGGLVHDVSYEDVCVRNSPNPILLDTA